MSERSIFHQTLGHFLHEFASGDIIRKYTDCNYSIKEMKQHLDFPTPLSEIYRIAWTHLLSTGQILLNRPDYNNFQKFEYVKDISPYGKVSYRKVPIQSIETQIAFHEYDCNLALLNEANNNFDQTIYVEIPFGVLRYKDKEMYHQILKCLEESDADYIDSMFTERKYIYYRLNEKMSRILTVLINNDLYHGIIFLPY